MNPFNEEEFLRDKARALSSGLFLRLDEFVNDFPGGTPGQLIALIKLFLKEIDVQLEITSSRKLLWGYLYLVEQLANSLDWLDNAHTAQTPRGLVQLLEEIASKLYQDAILLVAPTTENNYSIVDLVPYYKLLAEDSLPSKSADSLIQKFPKLLYLVRFPRVERENVLNHAIFGHEFGHPVADDFLRELEQQPEYARRLEQVKQRIQTDDDLSINLSEAMDEIERSKLLSEYVDDVQKIHRRALEELVSDSVGIYIFGPSALFASLDVLLQSSLDDAPSNPDYYPPGRFRLRFMARMSEMQEHINAIKSLELRSTLLPVRDSAVEIFKYLDRVTESTDDDDSIKDEPLVRIAYEWVNETLPHAVNHARERVSRIIYSASTASEDLPALLERLAIDVPPNEIGSWPDVRTPDWRSAMLASWLSAVSATCDDCASLEERTKRTKTIHKLALKGIEYSLLQQRYVQFKTGVR